MNTKEHTRIDWGEKLMGHSQSMLTGIFLALNVCIRKEEKFQINKNCNSPSKKLKKNKIFLKQAEGNKKSSGQ